MAIRLPSTPDEGPVLFFDNEPANCNTATQLFPDADIALLETQKVPGAPEPEDGICHITDFRVL